MEISEHKAHDSIINLLHENFINYEDGGLKKVYQQLMDYSKDPIDKTKIGFTSISNIKYLEEIKKLPEFKKITTIASDLPVYIKSQKDNAETIMICAMDSLPPEPNMKNTSLNIKNPSKPSEQFKMWNEIGFDLKSNVGFWAPFSLITNDEGPNSDFFKELIKEYNLYVTDVYKLFFYIDNGNDTFNKSNTITSYKKIENHRKILEKEIEIIKPHCIITLGNNSRNSLLKISVNKTNNVKKWNETNDVQIYNYKSGSKTSSYECNIISSPHISGAANGAKSYLLNNLKYQNILEDGTKKMAKIIISKIKEI
jgi:hypothetical protein